MNAQNIQDGGLRTAHLFVMTLLLQLIVSVLATPNPDVIFLEQRLDPDCVASDTCCADSSFRTIEPDPKADTFKCVQLYRDESRPVLMIDQCKTNWKGDDYFREMCEASGEALSDPVLLIPGTNTIKRVTYKNLFCALCNDEDINNITFFNLYLFVIGYNGKQRVVDKSELTNLRFVDDQWRLADNDRFVSFRTEIPTELEPYVYWCSSNDVVSKCANAWTINIVRKRCEDSHTAFVICSHSNVTYRNVHCALCNFRSVNNLSCKNAKIIPEDMEARQRTPFNLGLLLDVNPSNGNIVGRTRKCKINHVYHPKKDICIRLAGCFRGHIYKYGECVRINKS